MTTTRAALKRTEQYLRLHVEHPPQYEVVSGAVWSSRPEASGKYCLTIADLRALVAAARRWLETEKGLMAIGAPVRVVSLKEMEGTYPRRPKRQR